MTPVARWASAVAAVLLLAGCDLPAAQGIVTEEPQRYVAAMHGFSIDLPGSPVVGLEAVPIQDIGNVPTSSYRVESSDRRIAYLVAMGQYDAVGLKATNPRRGLAGAMEAVAKNLDGRIASESNQGLFRGIPRARATITGTNDGVDVTLRALFILKKNTLFVVMTGIVDDQASRRCMKSFRFEKT